MTVTDLFIKLYNSFVSVSCLSLYLLIVIVLLLIQFYSWDLHRVTQTLFLTIDTNFSILKNLQTKATFEDLLLTLPKPS